MLDNILRKSNLILTLIISILTATIGPYMVRLLAFRGYPWVEQYIPNNQADFLFLWFLFLIPTVVLIGIGVLFGVKHMVFQFAYIGFVYSLIFDHRTTNLSDGAMAGLTMLFIPFLEIVRILCFLMMGFVLFSVFKNKNTQRYIVLFVLIVSIILAKIQYFPW